MNGEPYVTATLDHHPFAEETAVACSVRDRQREPAGDQQRLQARAELDSNIMAGALRRLASVLSAPGVADVGPRAKDPLLAACQAVGAVLGIDIQRPSESGPPPRDPLENIARASRVRLRRVALRGAWWKEDNGPLVAYVADGRRPVALLPAGAGSYELYDVVRGIRVRMDGGVAASLEPFAFCFYRSLPTRVLRGVDLIRFGFRGSRRDLVIVLLMGVLGGLLGLLTPLATGLLFDTNQAFADRRRQGLSRCETAQDRSQSVAVDTARRLQHARERTSVKTTAPALISRTK